MADRQVYLKTNKWSLAFCLGLQVVFIILLFGRQPLLLRRLIYPSAGDRSQDRKADFVSGGFHYLWAGYA